MNIPRTIANSGALSGAGLLGAALLFLASTPVVQAAPDDVRPHRQPLSAEEMQARRAEIFAAVDGNGDGLISAEEFAAAELPRRPHRVHHGDHHEGRGYRIERGGPDDEGFGERQEAMAAMEEELFQALDTDADGVLSREEFATEAMMAARAAAMKSRLFERADQNGDGYLSPDEFPPRRMGGGAG